MDTVKNMKKEIQLSTIAEINLGVALRGRMEEDLSGVPMIQPKDISATDGILYQQVVPTDIGSKAGHYLLQDQDILFSLRGNYSATIFDAKAAAPYGERFVASSNFFVIRLHTLDAIPAFVAWQLNQGPCQQYFERQAEGSLVKTLRRGLLEATPITLPGLSYQEKIIALDQIHRQEQYILTELIEKNRQIMYSLAQQLTVKDSL